MRFLLDQEVYARTTSFLSNLDHDVVTAAETGKSRAEDKELLDEARRLGGVLITRDRHFGAVVFGRGARTGVIYLRIPPASLDAVHGELARVLASRTEDQLRNACVVVEPGRRRFRTLGR